MHAYADILENFTAPGTVKVPLGDLINALPAAVYITDAAGRINHYNDAAVDLWGRRPDLQDEHWCGSWRLYYPDGRRMRHDRCPMARALKSGEAIRGEEAIAERPDGSRVNFLAYPMPLRGPAGEIVGAVNMLVDITARKANEIQLESRIRQLQAVSELGIVALAGDDLQDLFDQATVRLSEALDVEMVKVLELQPGGHDLLLRAGLGWQAGLVGRACVGAGLDSQAGYTLSVHEPVIVTDLATETRFNGPTLLLDHGVVSGLSTTILGGCGAPFGVIGAHTTRRRAFTSHDVHFLQSVANILAAAVQRKAYRVRQSVLGRELAHRVKNNLAVVRSIARQAGQSAGSIEAFTASFDARLKALSLAQDLLTESGWTGTSLSKLLDLTLEDQIGETCLRLDVEDITLSAEGTQTLAMVINELMTNAIKYGAFSNGEGSVAITGERRHDGDHWVYRLVWSESGGPPVEQPTQGGFGSKLVHGMVKRQCQGELSVDWRRDGLRVECVLPMTAISGSDGSATPFGATSCDETPCARGAIA